MGFSLRSWVAAALLFGLITAGALAGPPCELCRCFREDVRVAAIAAASPPSLASRWVLYSYSRQCVFPIAGVHFSSDGGQRARRTCFANQKTIAGAIEMYRLDTENQCHHEAFHAFMEKGPKSPAVAIIPDEFLQVLVKASYLQSVPEELTSGAGVYLLVNFPESNGIACLGHGEIQAQASKTFREDLLQRGVKDPHLLSLAVGEPAGPWGVFHCRDCAVGDFTIGLLFLDIFLSRSMFYLVFSPFLLFLAALFAPISTVILTTSVLVRAGMKGFLTKPAPEAPPPTRLRVPAPLALDGPPETGVCPFCSSREGSDMWVACPACRTAHHGQCWVQSSGCTIYGCRLHAREAPRETTPVLK